MLMLIVRELQGSDNTQPVSIRDNTRAATLKPLNEKKRTHIKLYCYQE